MQLQFHCSGRDKYISNLPTRFPALCFGCRWHYVAGISGGILEVYRQISIIPIITIITIPIYPFPDLGSLSQPLPPPRSPHVSLLWLGARRAGPGRAPTGTAAPRGGGRPSSGPGQPRARRVPTAADGGGPRGVCEAGGLHAVVPWLENWEGKMRVRWLGGMMSNEQRTL